MNRIMVIPVESFEFKGKIGSPVIDKSDTKLRLHSADQIIIAPTFSDTEIKLYEADFFLKFIQENSSHHALILYGLSAFLTAARSITLFLQAECNGKEGFETWYAGNSEALQKNEFAKFLLETRNIAVHKMYANITLTFERKATLNKIKKVYEVSKSTLVGFEFDKYKFTSGLRICSDYLKLLEGVIADAKGKGFLNVDPNHGHNVRFTISGLPTKKIARL